MEKKTNNPAITKDVYKRQVYKKKPEILTVKLSPNLSNDY